MILAPRVAFRHPGIMRPESELRDGGRRKDFADPAKVASVGRPDDGFAPGK